MARGSWTLILLVTLAAPAAGAVRAPLAIPAMRPAAQYPDRYRPILLRVDSLARTGRHDEAHALMAPMIRDARARHDRFDLATLLSVEGQMYVSFGRPRPGEPPLREALGIARALGDTTLIARALRWLAVSIGTQGRPAESAPLFAEVLAIGIARHDPGLEGFGRFNQAYMALQRGDARGAVSGYRRAAELIRAAGDERRALDAITGLGHAYSNLGEWDSARACYSRVAAGARAIGHRWNEAQAENNLGVLEFTLGDPGMAVEHYRRAYDLQRLDGNVRESLTPALNIAIAHKYLGLYDDAAIELQRSIAICDSEGLVELRTPPLVQLAGLRSMQGRHREAAALYRDALGRGDSLPVWTRVDVVLGLSRTLSEMDSTGPALALIERTTARLGDQVPSNRRPQLDALRGEMLLDLGRNAEAIEWFRRADREADSLGLRGSRLGVLGNLARAQTRMGRRDSALATLRRAVGVWEEERGVPRDPQWRAQRGTTGRLIYTRLAALLLDAPPGGDGDARVSEAFDLLQRYKARTLHERMTGPAPAGDSGAAAGGRGFATLDALQRHVLRDRELFLDVYLGPDTSLVFAVTRTACRVVRLPGDVALAPRVRLYRELLASPARAGAGRAGPALVERASEAMGETMFAGLEDLLRESRHVVIASDGVMNLLPPGALFVPRIGGQPARALIEDRDVSLVPSATMLAEYRARPAGRAAETGRILAFAGLRRGGGPLPGAAREVGRLDASFRDVEVRGMGGSRARDVSANELAGYEVLHFAAHTSIDDQHPWRSGVLLGRGEASRDARYLRAAEIAGSRLPARLAVLSGCESAGGPILSGEGVQGLASAFLAAGVPTVVATLWPVDDRATADLMAAFYAGLGRGESAARALRGAQRALMHRPATRHPFFWAGFVLVGDGDARVPLRARPPLLVLAFAGLALAAVGTVLALRRTGRRVPS